MSFGAALDALEKGPPPNIVAGHDPGGALAGGGGPRGGQAPARKLPRGEPALARAGPARVQGKGGEEPGGLPLPCHVRAASGANRCAGSWNASSTAFKRRFAAVDLQRARSKNLTPYDVLIIASMVEREAQVPRERRLIASVIYNRLHEGIPLGIDATLRYATGNWTRPLQVSQLEAPRPTTPA